jgi:plastocyanin
MALRPKKLDDTLQAGLKIGNQIMKKSCLFALIVSLTTLSSTYAGDISGTVTLKGTPPAEKDIVPLKDDPNCGKLHSTMPKTRFYVTGAGGGLADVVVMLKGAAGKGSPSTTPALLDQKGCEYSPYVMAVQAGQKILVKNSDPVLHNVHAVPQVPGNNEKNQAQAPGGPDLTFTFDKPENFLKMQCDVHNWMFAYVTVADSPYFAVTDKDGKFTIKNVPDGKYTIVAMHRKAAPASSPVTEEVDVKGNVTKDFTLNVK